MKKKLGFVLAMVLAVAIAFAGCGGDEDNKPKPKPLGITLLSDATQDMKVDESMVIIYRTEPEKNAPVTFESSDPTVVTVDEYANVEAVGEGTAIVTITLSADKTKKVTVTYNVTRTFFIHKADMRVGESDLEREDEGVVLLKGGQAQVLANAKGQRWIMKASVFTTGVLNGDWGGGWGLSSNRVDAAHSLGSSMYWFGLQRPTAASTATRAYYGGWGIPTGYIQFTPDNSKQFPIDKKIDLTLIRDNVSYYMTASYKDETAEKNVELKARYDLPLFKDVDTYPGIYAQNENVEVTNFAVVTSAEEIDEAVTGFATATNVEINRIDTRLLSGASYQLSAKVTPDLVADKTVEFSIQPDSVDGATITKEGLLTLTAACSGNVIVRATSVNNPEVYQDITYTSLTEKAPSTHELFDSAAVVKDSPKTNIALNAMTHATPITFRPASGTGGVDMILGGGNYVPMNHSGDKWKLAATLDPSPTGTWTNGSIGIMAATPGYMDGFRVELVLKNGADSTMRYGSLYGELKSQSYALYTGMTQVDIQKQHKTIELIKDGGTFHIVVNGKLLQTVKTNLTGDATPVLYAINSTVPFGSNGRATNLNVPAISLEKEATKVDEAIQSYKFNAGGYVTRGTGADIDKYTVEPVLHHSWLPDNNFLTGLKWRNTFKGEYTMEFTMSDILPAANADGSYDGKLLIYLRSERDSTHTSSLQFTFNKKVEKVEGQADKVTITNRFVANLNDQTWDQYEIKNAAGEVIDMSAGEHKIKVVKTMTKIQLFIDGEEITFKDADGKVLNILDNKNNQWTQDTVCTPGIGTYNCGVKLSGFTVTQNA